MKRAVIGSVLAAALLLCACDKKDSSQTESQIVSGTTTTTATTKATSLTIASQSTTETTTSETEATTTTLAPETTAEVFTLNADGLADKDTVISFCDTVADKWAEMSNTGEDAGLEQYCKYADCDRFMQLSAKLFDAVKFHTDKLDLDVQEYKVSGSYVTVKGIYRSKTAYCGIFIFIVENNGGSLLLNDMLYDVQDSPDNRFRNELLKDPKPDYWADESRYQEILEKTREQA